VASGTVVTNGAEQVFGGVTRAVTLNAGASALVTSGGVASGTIINSGASEYVYANGTVSGTNISGGLENLSVSASATGTTVGNGGIQQVGPVAIATATKVMNGGEMFVLSGGLAASSVVGSGGMAFVSSGGTLSGGTVISGGSINVAFGGNVTGGMTISGGAAVLSGTMAAGQSVTFAGAGGDLVLNDLPDFAATIKGFATGDAIDLGGFAFTSAATATFAEAGSLTSGSLTVVAGTQHASLTLLGNFTSGAFSLANDGHGGSFVHYN
jgi:autotransporter passenger strand-loop-strand repeat protein